MNQDSLISIVIVTYNSEDEIVGCLDSIFKNTVPVEVYVVDNDSRDGTRKLLKDYSEKNSRVNLILNNDNKGLAAANNQPLPLIKTKYTLILNPDILLKSDTLTVMLNAMEADPSIGMLGPLSLFEDGTPHVSAHAHYNFFSILLWRTVPHTLMRYVFDRFSSFSKQQVLFVSGACYMIPSHVFKELGGYDPALFLTISDVADIGVRLKKKGYKAIFDPAAVITHFSGRSNAPLKFLTQYWGLTGDLYFIHKHMGALLYVVAKIVFAFTSAMRCIAFAMLVPFGNREGFKAKVKMYGDLTKALLKYSIAPKSS